ncbi:putative polysaccharide biosynthesis protein [Pediococcus acidilactici]|uniref:putative polysaccharide biosynthesis protein n=1 Tax=Pediococcus acidilactici TaxID=1254 RepID=UPI00097E7EF8|nr:polysaccharide biosynthesis protein [Pediococcus acidilactici]QDJ22145.1 polysaccharide biosynthesis protein [Pediococcus acidilactici]SJM43665.1 Membrane protein involved in the export of O-antigen, teichoic acid lipoteichoic acids [Pediococcus acidilactici]
MDKPSEFDTAESQYLGSQPLRENNGNSSSKAKMLEGSAWMTAGSIFSRILGAIYIIPWVIWFGVYSDQANALYTKGYNIYSFFLIAAIAGIPSAISKQVAHYNAINEFALGQRLYKRGLLLSVGTGVVCAAILFFGAPFLNDGDPNVTTVLHALAWAVLVIPTMSLTRGFFQGYQEMGPSAVSQFIEQLARVAYMLVTAYLIMYKNHGDWVYGVAQSTFAAFIGALGGLLVLIGYFVKYRRRLRYLSQHSVNGLAISTTSLYKEIIAQAVPFIIIGSAITIFQLIDQYTFFRIMRSVSDYSATVLNNMFAIFAFNANKLVMIVISLASALAVTSVPILSEAKTRGDRAEISRQVADSILLFAFLMIPSALGMAAVAQPAYTLFYHLSDVGTAILQFNSYVAIVLGLFTVISAAMQGIGENVLAVKYFVVGMIVKFIFQFPMVAIFSAVGSLISTAIGFAVVNWLILRHINREYGLDYDKINGFIGKIITYSFGTFFIAFVVTNGLYLVMNPANKVQALIVILVAATLGGLFYVVCVLKSRLADEIIGGRAAGLRRMLKIK